MENGTNGKRQFLFISCKQKWKFIFLGRQMFNGNRRLLFQKTCPSMNFPMVKAIVAMKVSSSRRREKRTPPL